MVIISLIRWCVSEADVIGLPVAVGGSSVVVEASKACQSQKKTQRLERKVDRRKEKTSKSVTN